MSGKSQRWITAAATCLIVIFAFELWLSVRHLSQTFDESSHMYAGYEYWTHGDFGVNPEHPPLVKLLATLPLLHDNIKQPGPPLDIFFRAVPAIGGMQLLYANNADQLLFRSRVAASLLTLILALLVFTAGREMFAAGVGLLALLIFVFEPNILANGALVTTDLGATCGMFAAVYTFYRYAKQRTILRLVICGIVTGLAFASKHSTVLLLPIFVLLAIAEIIMQHPAFSGSSAAKADSAKNDSATDTSGKGAPAGKSNASPSLARRSAQWAGALVVIAALGLTVLWSFYGFRYTARPGGRHMTPPLAAYAQQLHHPLEAHITLALSHYHVLPAAYVYGLLDIEIITQHGRSAYLLGKEYFTGKWFYFPITLLIKSTLGFLLLLGLLVFAKEIWAKEKRREVLFLVIPALFYFATALTSHLDIGVRHVLPIFPFLIVLAAAGAWALMRRSRRWAYVVVALLILHCASSLHAFPYYLSYSNEAWGGPKNTYKELTDANTGWTSSLKAVSEYIAAHQIKDCWFAYSGSAPYTYYHIPCRPLPTFFSGRLGFEKGITPAAIDGTIFISEIEHSGFWWGPGNLNPYQQFTTLRPDDIIAGDTLVFRGHFDVPTVSALSHVHVADNFLQQGKFAEALPDLQTAIALNPNSLDAHATLALALGRLKRKDEARAEFQKALDLAHTQYPEFQAAAIPELERDIKQVE